MSLSGSKWLIGDGGMARRLYVLIYYLPSLCPPPFSSKELKRAKATCTEIFAELQMNKIHESTDLQVFCYDIAAWR